MPAPNLVPQGTTYNFAFQLDGCDTQAFTYILSAKQYPNGPYAFTPRAIAIQSDNIVYGAITAEETALMDIGLWYVSVTSTDADETVNSRKRISITVPMN